MEKKQRRKTTNQAASARKVPVISRNESAADFDPDYTYVYKNLKKIGVLAVCFITFLVVLSFVL